MTKASSKFIYRYINKYNVVNKEKMRENKRNKTCQLCGEKFKTKLEKRNHLIQACKKRFVSKNWVLKV